ATLATLRTETTPPVTDAERSLCREETGEGGGGLRMTGTSPQAAATRTRYFLLRGSSFGSTYDTPQTPTVGRTMMVSVLAITKCAWPRGITAKLPAGSDFNAPTSKCWPMPIAYVPESTMMFSSTGWKCGGMM